MFAIISFILNLVHKVPVMKGKIEMYILLEQMKSKEFIYHYTSDSFIFSFLFYINSFHVFLLY